MAVSRTQELNGEMVEYAQKNNIQLNPNEKVVSMILKGLIINETTSGVLYCPCKPGEKGQMVLVNNQMKYKSACPCPDSQAEIEANGKCHCGLFVKKEE